AAAAATALLAMAWSPAPAAAHAIGGTFQLPVPLWLYLVGAAAAVAASIAVIAAAPDRRRAGSAAGAIVPARLAAVTPTVLRISGVLLWYGAIAVGAFVGDISPLPAVILWVVVWIALPIVAAALGNPWPSMSPFRTTFGALRWVLGRGGVTQDLGLRYPRRLARWPAVILLGAAIWAELILPGGEVAATVAAVMATYTLLTLLGMLAFGPAAWLRNAEIFEVLLGWYGRIGPIGRRSVDPALCAACPDACEVQTCVDCPGCATRADDTQRRAELRPWFRGLADLRGAVGWSDAAFVVLLLAGITYDGLRETAFGGVLLTAILAPINAEFGLTAATFLLVDTAFLALVYAAFLVAFAVVVAATLRLRGGHAEWAATAGAYAATLLPIAAGYVVAHYFTLVIQAATWLPALLADPLMSLAPQVDWIPIGLVWYLSVGAIVGGHVAGVALAHRLTLDRAGRNALAVGLPMVLLMVCYTVLSLWIIAQPIVVDPGGAAPPEAVVEREAA
ncbi:MAG: hypothetical protein ABI841_07525, partial [Chloroflexota bacterium]